MTDGAILRFLRKAGLVGEDETTAMVPLAGGVSSDIWKIEARSGTVCVKQALAQLKTEKVWHAPVERNAYEADWIRAAAAIVPTAVPHLLAEDRDAGMFAMAYLDPADYPVWKEQLRDGIADPSAAAKVGKTLGSIHAATAGDTDIARRFATDDIFRQIRIEPYLLRTAEAHPDLAQSLTALANITARTRKVLVHGDVSPKNILTGPDGPVFLDAECARYGDPAFDIAFCLNHLLLKCIWTPGSTDDFLACFAALTDAYLSSVDWEPVPDLEQRTAALLPGLLLARIDGASPVEYITRDADRNRVRRAARKGLLCRPTTLRELCSLYRKDIQE
jgi:aminoglycoside phosphotransferase (APT) family kinase protein